MKTDIQIAQEAKMLPITDIATKLGIEDDELELYGKYKAKINDAFLREPQAERTESLFSLLPSTPPPQARARPPRRSVSVWL